MLIDIDLWAAPAAVQLVEPDDFGAFKILARGAATSRDRFEHAVKRFGYMTEDGHVFVDVGAVRSLAGERARERDWLGSFHEMLELARAHGWTDDAGAIRAHVQWNV